MSVLYLSYNGLTEPLGRRQVLPYLVGLSQRGWRIRIVSFEKPETADASAVSTVAEATARAGLDWHPLRYHRGVPLVKAYDMIRGMLSGLRWRGDLQLIHARSTVAAAMAAPLAAGLGVPWVFDVRGLVAEEYVDGGHWKQGGALSGLTSLVEQRLMRRASGLVFLTTRIRSRLAGEGAFGPGVPVVTIPCCADLDTFRPASAARARIRAELGLGEAPVLTYAGSLGSWYRFTEMAAFFSVARRELPGLRFLVLTPQVDLAQRETHRFGLEDDVVIRGLPPDLVPSFLAAADAGVCFLADVPSKNASSPTKYGEYLASGLPVVTNSWTGDAARLAGEPAWILIDRFSEAAYLEAATRLRRVLEKQPAARTAARELAQREFSLDMAVDRYEQIYREVLSARS